MRVGPSVVRTLSGALDVVSAPSEVLTLSGASDVGPDALRCVYSSVPRIWSQFPPNLLGSARWLGREEGVAAAAGEFSKLPPSVFFFSTLSF